MSNYTSVLADEVATQSAGGRLARALVNHGLGSEHDPWILFLRGQLGAGKTTFVRGMLQALGHAGAVKSPTYTLVEPYELTGVATDTCIAAFHFDLYRLLDPEELELLGFRDVLAREGGLCLIEWPEKAMGYLVQPDLEICLDVLDSGRSLELRPFSARGELMLSSEF